MSNEEVLTLPDEVFLLAFNRKTGLLPNPALLEPLLAGAVLLELALQDRIGSEGRAAFLLKNTSPSGNEFLDKCMLALKDKAANHYFKYWIAENGGFGKIDETITKSHKARKLMVPITRRIAFLFPQEGWDHPNPTLQQEIFKRATQVREAGEKLEPRDYCLVKCLQAGLYTFEHLITHEKIGQLPEPSMVRSETVDEDIIQRVYGTILHCNESS